VTIEGPDWNGWHPGVPLLADQVALIAGGGRGIGEATSRILAAAGASVAVLDNERERAESVARAISEGGAQALPIVADVRDEDACAGAVERTRSEFGGVDVLANVAGGMVQYAEWRHLRHWTTADWDAIVHLNLRYVFWLSRAVIPIMEARGRGSIVSVTSISGVFGSPNHSAYGAAKAGLIQLTKTLAVECGRSGIRANAVSPGAIATPATEATMTEERRRTLSETTPLQRPGRPEDIARAVLFLASPMAEYVTGQMLLVDGGVSAKFPLGGIGTHISEASVPTA
jgi:NAD(P)-dependent dehydrogenase (short-subunit alcohol dehydrogenase family)